MEYKKEDTLWYLEASIVALKTSIEYKMLFADYEGAFMDLALLGHLYALEKRLQDEKSSYSIGYIDGKWVSGVV